MLALLAGGCANIPSVGPNYHAPETKAPAHWTEPLAGGETNSAAATAAWWKNFHDAELDSLIDTRGQFQSRSAHRPVTGARSARAIQRRFRRSLADCGRRRLLMRGSDKANISRCLGDSALPSSAL